MMNLPQRGSPPPMRLLALMVALIAVISCDGGGRDAAKIPLGSTGNAPFVRPTGESLPAPGSQAPPIVADAKAALDSGNALFRQKQYAQALSLYRLAASRAPEHAAPHFGIYMTARALNNASLADSALAAINARGAAPPTAPHAAADSAPKKHRVGPAREDDR